MSSTGHHPADITTHVVPESEWSQFTPDSYFLGICQEPEGRLVTLISLVQFKAQTLPKLAALQTIFIPLIQDDGAIAKYLYLLDRERYAKPFFHDGRITMFYEGFGQFLPGNMGLKQCAGPADVLRVIADGWRKKEWPLLERHLNLGIEKHLAMKHSLAHKLYGWGSLPQEFVPYQPQTLDDVVKARTGPRKGTEWLPEEIVILKAASPQRRNYQRIADRFGTDPDTGKPYITGKRIGQLIRTDPQKIGKRQQNRLNKAA